MDRRSAKYFQINFKSALKCKLWNLYIVKAGTYANHGLFHSSLVATPDDVSLISTWIFYSQ